MDISRLIDEPDTVYHSQTGCFLSSHRLAEIRQHGLEACFAEQPEPDQALKDVFRVGTLVHSYTLEGPGQFRKRYEIGGPINPKTGRSYGTDTFAFRSFCQMNDHKEWVTPEELEKFHTMATAVWKDKKAGPLLQAGWAEKVARCEYMGLNCQGRIDWLTDDGKWIVDLKTIRSVDSLDSHAKNYGYLHQMAFYQALTALTLGIEEPQVLLVAIEKKADFPRCRSWPVPLDILRKHRKQNEALMIDLHKYLTERAKECPKSKQLLAG